MPLLYEDFQDNVTWLIRTWARIYFCVKNMGIFEKCKTKKDLSQHCCDVKNMFRFYGFYFICSHFEDDSHGLNLKKSICLKVS